MLAEKIGILGLGLIGGSLARSLKKRAPKTRIATLKRKDGDVSAAFSQGILDEIHDSLETLLADIELLILATPLSSIISIASQIAEVPRERPLIVLDVGSVKGKIAAAFEAITSDEMEFVATHPMAGMERNGFEASHEDLFCHCSWIVTPHSKNKKSTLDKVERWIAQVGARSLFLSPEEHDRQMALISHLPYLLAYHYLEFTLRSSKEALKIAGPGFHSFTRLAHDNPQMRAEIFEENRDWIDFYLKSWLEGARNL